MKRMKFAAIRNRARKAGCVLEKEAFGYSLYDNTRFVQDDCANLTEVVDALEIIEFKNVEDCATAEQAMCIGAGI